MQKTANFIGLIKAAQQYAPNVTSGPLYGPSVAQIKANRGMQGPSEATNTNRRIAAATGSWYGDQGAFNKEYKSRMTSGMGYSGRDVLDQMADEAVRAGYARSREEAVRQLTPYANHANMLHNSNAIRKYQEAGGELDLDQDFDTLSKTVPGMWGINQDARQTANFAANEGRGAAMRKSPRVKAMTGRDIMAKREAYNQEKARRKQQPATQGQAQGFNGGAYLDKITADANARINGGDVDWKNPPAMQAYDNARINGTQSHATPFPAGIQDLRNSGTSPVQPPQVTAPATAPATATTATGSTPAQAPTVTGYGNKQGMDAWKDAERKRLKGKYDPGKIEAALTNDAYRKSNGGRNYVDMSRYRPLNAQ